VAFLRGLPTIDPARVGVWGLSEGGWVAPLAAARSPDVAFVVAVAASGVSPARSTIYQIDNALRHAGVSAGAVEAQLRASTLAYRAVRSAGLVPGGDVSFELDPTRVWRRVRQPVLLLYGDRDRVVPPKVSAALIAEALERAGNRASSVRVFAGANHAMVLAEGGFTTFIDYHRGVDHAPGYFDTMTAWMGRPAPGAAVAPGDRGRPPGPVERLRSVDDRPWHESLAVQLGLLALFVTVFLARSLAELTRRLRRRRHRRPATEPPGVRRARTLSAWLSPLALLFLLAAAVVMVGYPSEPLVLVRRALQGWAVVVAALSVLLVGVTVRTSSQFPTVAARLAHGLMAATAAL
jgi:dienelactone hydrolase